MSKRAPKTHARERMHKIISSHKHTRARTSRFIWRTGCFLSPITGPVQKCPFSAPSVIAGSKQSPKTQNGLGTHGRRGTASAKGPERLAHPRISAFRGAKNWFKDSSLPLKNIDRGAPPMGHFRGFFALSPVHSNPQMGIPPPPSPRFLVCLPSMAMTRSSNCMGEKETEVEATIS